MTHETPPRNPEPLGSEEDLRVNPTPAPTPTPDPVPDPPGNS